MAFQPIDEAEIIRLCQLHLDNVNYTDQNANIVFLGDGTLIKIGNDADIDAAWLAFLQDVALPPTVQIPRLVQPAVEDRWFYYTRMEHKPGETLKQIMDRNEGQLDPILAQRYMQATRDLAAAVNQQVPGGLEDAVPSLRRYHLLHGHLFSRDFESAWEVQSMDEVHDAFDNLRNRCGAPPMPPSLAWEFSQGDISPYNALVISEAIMLLDFTWAGFRPPGWDLWALKHSIATYPKAFKTAMLQAYEAHDVSLDREMEDILTQMAKHYSRNRRTINREEEKKRYERELAERGETMDSDDEYYYETGLTRATAFEYGIVMAPPTPPTSEPGAEQMKTLLTLKSGAKQAETPPTSDGDSEPVQETASKELAEIRTAQDPDSAR